MPEPVKPPYRLCVCGHVRSHHGKRELAQLPYDPRCQWRGCGCPHYLDADEPAGQEAPQAEDAPRRTHNLFDCNHGCTRHGGRSNPAIWDEPEVDENAPECAPNGGHRFSCREGYAPCQESS